jgi:hypothetical protein
MYNRLNQHIHANNIITPEQFGFRKDRNMETAIYARTNHILKALDEHSQTLGIFVIYQKLLIVGFMIFFWINWLSVVFVVKQQCGSSSVWKIGNRELSYAIM